MSGLEPLVALGLACNILQIVHTAKQSVTVCRNILQSGSVDPALNARVQDLTKICEELKSRQQVATGTSATAEQQELISLAQSTSATASELKSAIEKLSGGSSKGKLLGALEVTVKTAWRKSKLEKLEKNMLDTQRILETRLLVHICSQNDALAIKQREDFSTLGDELCTFISNYEQGKRDMEGLLREGFTSVENHVTIEATKTRHDLSTKIDDLAVTFQDCDLETHVTAEAVQTRNEISTKLEDLKVVVKDTDNQDVKRLLASLRYPSMNERRNQISESHEGTFEWIFGPEPVHSDTDESSVFELDDEMDSEEFYNEPEEEIDSTNSSESGRTRHSYDPVFLNWLQSTEQSLFWISGKPGAGKSTLMKFLLEDDRTQEYLNQAHPNTLLISHFIWSVGDPMQRSLKGLLCSLLHQLVTSIKTAPNLLLGVSKISQLKMKEAPGDWSVKELKAAVISVLKHSETPVCLLVDGLDEIDKADGPLVLLDLITQIRHIPGVKILVSSRPEPAFMSRLEKESSLRVQDLTRDGIFRYCKDRLSSLIGTNPRIIHRKDAHHLAQGISDRAAGVFLWASLALKSLERGILNGDSETHLQNRLEGLPDDLNALYKNMWDRLNEDKRIYREEAAKYLNFAMLALDVLGIVNNFVFSDSPTQLRGYALVHLLALETHTADRIIEETDSMNEKDIESLYDKFSAFLQAIPTRCAGILEINRLGRGEMGSKGFNKGHLSAMIGFVHRSAREFLCNTEYGQEILQHDRSTAQDRFRAFLKACMATDRLFTTSLSSIGGSPWEAGHYTLLCFRSPGFRLSLQGILDILDYMENHNFFTFIGPGGVRLLEADKIGMLVLANQLEAVISSMEKAERSNGPLSAKYLCYLLMLAIRRSQYYFGKFMDEHQQSPTKMNSWLIASGKRVNIDATWRVPAIPVVGFPIARNLLTEEDYLNAPLLDIFIVDLLEKQKANVGPHLLKTAVQICDLLLDLKPTLEMRTLLFLSNGPPYSWEPPVIMKNSLVFVVARRVDEFVGRDTILLEVDTRFLLSLVCARLAPEVRDDDQMVFEKLALLRTIIGDTPGWVEVVGVVPRDQTGLDRGKRKVAVPNKLGPSGQEARQPGCIKGLQDLRWVTTKSQRLGRNIYSLEWPDCPNIQHLIDSFEYGSREVELSVLYEGFIERGLIVTNREVNPDTWPPPRHDPPESSTGGALEVIN